MTKPIYKLGIAKAKAAWYQLSEEEQNSLFEKGNQKKAELGVEDIVACDSRWSSEAWAGFGIKQFPNMEAVELYANEELGYFSLSELESVRKPLGLPIGQRGEPNRNSLRNIGHFTLKKCDPSNWLVKE